MSKSTTLPADSKNRLDTLYKDLAAHSETFSGYPCNLDYDYQELFRFLNFSINNVGDPFAGSNYKVNTHEIEREVIDFFVRLLKGEGEGECRGYVTNGGTEGNLFGLNLALKRFPNAILYFSARTHYSIIKIAKLIRAEYREIPVLSNGEMDYERLAEQLEQHHDRPAIINLNIGTTMTGAVDNLHKIRKALLKTNVTDYHLHADAALSGMILPFIDNPPPFNFTDGIDSIAISGHKFIGSPLPCGIALTRSHYIEASLPTISYVRVLDSTISGSRNGFTPLILWYAIQKYGIKGFQQLVNKCLANAAYTVKKFNDAGVDAWKNEHSITVVIPRPSESMINHWQLATHEDMAHIVVMPHFSKAFIDDLANNLLTDLKSKHDYR